MSTKTFDEKMHNIKHFNPPGHVKVLTITVPTFGSRVQEFNFDKLSHIEIERILQFAKNVHATKAYTRPISIMTRVDCSCGVTFFTNFPIETFPGCDECPNCKRIHGDPNAKLPICYISSSSDEDDENDMEMEI